MPAPMSAPSPHSAYPFAQPPVHWWEGLGITAGAVLLVMAGLMGLGEKAIRTATNPARAEAIAQSLADYSLPGGSKGVFGINIGSIKMAVVTNPPSKLEPSSVELLIARTPITTDPEAIAASPEAVSTPDNFILVSFGSFSLAYDLEGQFQTQSTQQERKLFCDNVVPVTIRRGSVTSDSGGSVLPAVRYEATSQIDDREHQIILTTAGDEAQKHAEAVFTSLRCR